MPTNLDDWLDYIGRQHSAEIAMGLDRVRTVWERLDKPGAPINIDRVCGECSGNHK